MTAQQNIGPREPVRREIPPTAGLTPHWRDLLPTRDTALDRAAAAFLGTDVVQIECSGTACLVIALDALHRLDGRRAVIVPAYTCPLVALAVAHRGLELRLCDLDADGIDFDPIMLARLCDRDTLAVVPTHLGGRVADVSTAQACAARVGAFMIEDAAQAFGARRHGIHVGLSGDVGVFSLAVGKGLTTYEGGLMVARDALVREALMQSAARLAPYSLRWEALRVLQLLGYHLAYRPALLPWAYGAPLRRALRRGDAVVAVGDDFGVDIPLHRMGRWRRGVGRHALARLPAFLAAARQRALARRAALAAIPGLEIPGDGADDEGVWPFLFVRFESEAKRDAALKPLWGAGLGVSRLFVHALPDYAYLRGLVAPTDVPNARAFAARTLTVSNSPWLDDAAFDRILREIAVAAAG